jgi:tellurite resistance protein TehA-like permease
MTLPSALRARVRTLDPGYFALVMATGIVSIDARQHGMPVLSGALFLLNAAAYLVLTLLSGLRLAWAWPEATADFTNPARGAGFLTFTAGSCVLAAQCLLVVRLPAAALTLAAVGAVSWAILIYLLLLVVITGRHKPAFRRSINGNWLVAVVSTQAVAVILILLSGDDELGLSAQWSFVALCLYLVGAALYLILITLIFYRLLFLPLAASNFTPPYWINMGALAISTLAGSLLVADAQNRPALVALVPFVRGFTLFFWANATWWIPLLAVLEIWRHGPRHVQLRYEIADWDIVFPLGMYTTGTFALAQVLDFPLLRAISGAGVYVSLVAWLIVAAGALRSGYRSATEGPPRR